MSYDEPLMLEYPEMYVIFLPVDMMLFFAEDPDRFVCCAPCSNFMLTAYAPAGKELSNPIALTFV